MEYSFTLGAAVIGWHGARKTGNRHPGPPHAALIIAEKMLTPIIRHCLKNTCFSRAKVQAVLKYSFKPRGRNEWHNRIRVKWNGSGYEVYPLEKAGDSVENFVKAEGVLSVLPDMSFNEGDLAWVELLCDEESIRNG
jgi:molybdopterin biosynthesis enzyme